MDITIQKYSQIAPKVLQRLGYALYVNREGKHSYVRRIHGTDFPRFHLYINQEDDHIMHCAVHLDQKAPSYMGTHAHGGDYDSDTVKEEVERIQQANKQAP